MSKSEEAACFCWEGEQAVRRMRSKKTSLGIEEDEQRIKGRQKNKKAIVKVNTTAFLYQRMKWEIR